MLFRFLPITSLAVGLLGFLFTFCEVQCSHQPLARFSGITMLVGGQGEIDPGMKSMSEISDRLERSQHAGDQEPRPRPDPDRGLDMSPNPFLIGSVILGLTAIVLLFRGRQGRFPIGPLVGAGLACLLVVVTRYDLESRMRERLGQTEHQDKFTAAMADLIQIEFGAGFYVPAFAFGLAFLFILMIPQLEKAFIRPDAEPTQPPTPVLPDEATPSETL